MAAAWRCTIKRDSLHAKVDRLLSNRWDNMSQCSPLGTSSFFREMSEWRRWALSWVMLYWFPRTHRLSRVIKLICKADKVTKYRLKNFAGRRFVFYLNNQAMFVSNCICSLRKMNPIPKNPKNFTTESSN